MAALLLAACDKTATPPTEPPRAAVRTEQPVGPPAALRRDLRTCEGDARGVLGEVEYGVRVDPSGRVAMVKVLQGSVPAAVLNCSLQRLRAWAFPASTEGAAFRFSMRFGEDAASKRSIKAAIRVQTERLKPCYDTALKRDPELFGKVTYVFAVSSAGRVTSVQTEVEAQAHLSAAMLTCTTDDIRGWSFEPDGTPKTLSFSVVFTTDRTPKGYRPTGFHSAPGRPGEAAQVSIRLGDGMPAGSESKAIKAAIKQRTSVLQDCYTRALLEMPTAGGKVRFDVSVAASGHVESVTIQPEPDATIPETMDACMQERMGAWQFPTDAAPRGAQVSFWVVFSESSAPSEAPADESLGPSP